MRKAHLLSAFALVIGLVGMSPASAQPKQEGAVAQGGVQMTIHTHSNDDPEWTGLLFETVRLSYDFVDGEDFSYSSRHCSGTAPFNDLGLDFTPDYPGVDDDDGTAAVRHHVEGTITEVQGAGGTIEGTITTVLCENGQETGNVLVSHFEGRFRRVSDNEIRISGRYHFSPTESTGTFAGIEGHGSIQGVFTCLAHQRDPSQPTCAERGHFTDFVGARGDLTKGPGEIGPGLRGTFRDATVLTG